MSCSQSSSSFGLPCVIWILAGKKFDGYHARDVFSRVCLRKQIGSSREYVVCVQ